MIERIKLLYQDLQYEWEEMMWKASPERKELAHLRLIAHEKAVKEGYVSPYVDPEQYTPEWVPKTKLR